MQSRNQGHWGKMIAKLSVALCLATLIITGCGGSGGGVSPAAAPETSTAINVKGMVILETGQETLALSADQAVARTSALAAAQSQVVACGAVPGGYIPIPDAYVSVSGEETVALTDENGCFDMTLAQPGLKVFTVTKTNANNGTTILKKTANVQAGQTIEFVGGQAITVYSTIAAMMVEMKNRDGESGVDPAAIEDYVIALKNDASVAALASAILAVAATENSTASGLDSMDTALLTNCKSAVDQPAFVNAAVSTSQVPRTGGGVTISTDVLNMEGKAVESVTATLSAAGLDPVVLAMALAQGRTYAATYSFEQNDAATGTVYSITLALTYSSGLQKTYTGAELAVTRCGETCGGTPVESCGDGAVNGEEQCDDGAANTNTACTPAYGASCSYCDTSCQAHTVAATAFCGDGSLNGSEQCDTGGSNTNTACTPAYGESCSYCDTACQTRTVAPGAFCGDGTLNSTEACDSGADNTNTACTPGYGDNCSYCDTSCETHTVNGPSCGDGSINGSEVCDNGGGNTDTACSPAYGGDCSYCDTSCEPHTVNGAYCGDSSVNGAETCDDGNTTTEACAYGQTSCTVCGASCTSAAGATAYCGDNAINGSETCDDGGANGTFGHCNSACSGTVTAICGNSAVEGSETCDAGEANTNTACTASYGGSCSYCNTSCASITVQGGSCGDGIVQDASGEECDDNNTESGDGCSSACEVELNYGGNTYFISETTKSWTDAQAACEGMGGYLFTTNNEAENLYFYNLLAPGRRYWMGFNDRSVEGAFVWTSGALNGFTKWASGEPNDAGGEDCTVFGYYDGGLWNDLSCSTLAYYVCEIGPDCGNGVIETGEACDSGANTGAPGNCNTACTGVTPLTCGNGSLDAGEACDDNNNVTESCAYGQTSCTVCDQSCVSLPGVTSWCGDGRVNSASGEACDDGNTTSGDGCSSTCARESHCGDYSWDPWFCEIESMGDCYWDWGMDECRAY